MGDDVCIDVERCPIRATQRVLGGKYKPVIIWYLNGSSRRFGEIQRIVPEATPRMLSKQLREMENDGLIHREAYSEMPPRTEYSLTELGCSVIPLISAMFDWGMAYMKNNGKG
ncbi:MAG: winged helix-turn-helix transcriptional regulator [Candidatus Methanomethylophilaceae archaeon]